MTVMTQTDIALYYRNQIDTYWADFLGCSKEALYQPGDTIINHANSPGLFCLSVGQSRIFSLAPDVDPTFLYEGLSLASIRAALEPAGQVTEIYGPGDVMYCTPATYSQAHDENCYSLANAKWSALERFTDLAGWHGFLQECPNLWDHAYGIHQDGEIVSAATAIIWGEKIGAIKVATLPGYRRRGYARAAVSAATQHLLKHTSYIPQYDAAADNVSSLHVAQALGFRCYGQIYYGKLNCTNNRSAQQ